MVRPRGKQQPRQRMPQELAAFAPGGAMAVDLAATKQGIRLALAREAAPRALARPGRRCRQSIPRRPAQPARLRARRDLELDVDAIGQRAEMRPR